MQSTKKLDSTGIAMYNNSDSGQKVADLGNFGIDKIQLFFPENSFVFPKGQPKEFDQLTHKSAEGRITEKFYLNTESFNCDISRNPKDGSKMFGLHFNPSKKLHPYELTHDSNVIYEHTREIKEKLLKSNIEINLDEALVTRFDLAHNIILDNPLSVYRNVFDSMKGLRQDKKIQSDTTYWGNRQNQFIIYDKAKELERNDLPANMVRGEMRILKSACMKSTFKTNKLIHLLNQEQGMDYKGVYNYYIESKLFRNTSKQLKFEFKELESMFYDFKEIYGNKGLDNFLKTIGIQELHKTPNTINFLIELIKQNFPERTARRKLKEVNDMLDRLRIIESKNDIKGFILLNQEFRSKIMAA